MTVPRRHLEGQAVMLTRRCLGRQFMLRPDEFINQVIRYEIGRYSERHGQTIHAVMAMSNHCHIGATDTEAKRSDFMRDIMREIAKKRNKNLDRDGYFWDSKQYDDTVLLDREAIEEKLLYIWLNPVEAGLVDKVEDWPGFMVLPRHWGKTMSIKVPDCYYGRRSKDVIEFTPQPPPEFDEMDLDEVRAHFEALIQKGEEQIRERRERNNKQYLGAKKIKEVDPFDVPRSDSAFEDGATRQRFAGKDATLLNRANNRYRQFLNDYGKKRDRWAKGHKKVEFPCGTVWMKKNAPVKCKAPRADEPGIFGQDKDLA